MEKTSTLARCFARRPETPLRAAPTHQRTEARELSAGGLAMLNQRVSDLGVLISAPETAIEPTTNPMLVCKNCGSRLKAESEKDKGGY
jgi:hypothetical protein